MALLHSSKEKTANIINSLTSNTFDTNAKLEAVHNLRTILKPSEKILGSIKLKSILQEGGTILKCNTYSKDFLVSYCIKLINCIGKNVALNPELFEQIEYILMELHKEYESLANQLFMRVCQIQSDYLLYFNKFIKISKHTLVEEKVLDWIENNNLEMECLARMSAKSPKVFQAVCSCLYLILVKTLGHWRVLEVTESFIHLVLSVCTKNNMNFLSLYPESCRRIVSLLMVSPKLYFDDIIKNEVLGLLIEMFLSHKKRVLILLSHYPDWLCVFRDYLNKTGVN